MIKFEHTEVLGWEHAIRGMRNPMNSWKRSDSDYRPILCARCGTCPTFMDETWEDCDDCEVHKLTEERKGFMVGPNDHDLMMRLANGGPVHAKYRRMITVYVDITAPLYWWKEFDTYKVGTVANSCSTMHKIAAKEFTLEDFSTEHLIGYGNNVVTHDDTFEDYGWWSSEVLDITITALNFYRQKYLETKDKKYWWQMIQLLPSSYNQKRTIMLNYEVLANIYKSRQNHKLDEWSGRDCFKDLARDCNTCAKKDMDECYGGKEGGFIQWIESLPYSEIITGKSQSEKMLEIGEKLHEGIAKALEEGPETAISKAITEDLKKDLGIVSPSEHLHIWANGKEINATPETEKLIKDLLKKEEFGLGFNPKKDNQFGVSDAILLKAPCEYRADWTPPELEKLGIPYPATQEDIEEALRIEHLMDVTCSWQQEELCGRRLYSLAPGCTRDDLTPYEQLLLEQSEEYNKKHKE